MPAIVEAWLSCIARQNSVVGAIAPEVMLYLVVLDKLVHPMILEPDGYSNIVDFCRVVGSMLAGRRCRLLHSVASHFFHNSFSSFIGHGHGHLAWFQPNCSRVENNWMNLQSEGGCRSIGCLWVGVRYLPTTPV
jgi:hypothetical protein